MLNEICIIIVVALLTSFVSMKCCIYTAVTAFQILSTLGLSPVYCVGYVQEVDGKNHYHAWVRIGSYDIEQSTLNLQHYDAVNYSEPDVMFNTTYEFISLAGWICGLQSDGWCSKGLCSQNLYIGLMTHIVLHQVCRR